MHRGGCCRSTENGRSKGIKEYECRMCLGLGNGRRARATGEEQQKSSLGWQHFAHVGENLKFILWFRGLKLVGLWPHLANICLLCVRPGAVFSEVLNYQH